MNNRLKAKVIGIQNDKESLSLVDSFICDGGQFSVLNSSNYVIFPGFCDVHVHFREPGFSYKETIGSGSASAARGGYTAVCTMPNLSPTPDCRENLEKQLELIQMTDLISVIPYGTITVGQKGQILSDMEAMADAVIAFSDDGKGVQNDSLMLEAMLKAKALGKMIVAHCEDESLLRGGYIHDGDYAKKHGHKGICSESEWGPIKRDLELVKKSGVSYHVCHISTKESVELIRNAKAQGLDVSCETAPHYLLMNDTDINEDGRFKMNPPIRSEEDRLALIEGIVDGTIDMIATDHAPHSKEEKSRGLEKSAFGVVGLETAFASLYTGLVKTGIITIEKLVQLLSHNPRKRFGIPNNGDFSVWDLNFKYTVEPSEFASHGKATPFEGWEFYGKNHLCVHNKKIVYNND